MEKKLVKTIVIDGKEWNLNIFVERRNSARVSFVNKGINIRLPKHLSTEEKNKSGKEMLDWAVAKIKEKPEKFSERVYFHGEEIFSLGRRYVVNIERRFSSKNSIRVNGEYLEFRIAEHYDDDQMQAYIRWNIRKLLARNHLNELIEHTRRINNNYFRKNLGEVSIKHMTSRWGHCQTRGGNIGFSTRLLLAPLPVIEYVIVHELAHLIEANHSKRFWNIVSSVDPHYRGKVNWLKKNGHTLML